jgi:hypothetical protein
MAKVWPVHEGRLPAIAEPAAVLPLADAVRLLDVEPQHLLTEPPTQTDLAPGVTWVVDRQAVLEVGADEAQARWVAGFYRSPLSADEAFFRLRVHQRLGAWWRDEWQKESDVDGQPAVWLCAVLKADAPDSEWAPENRERIQAAVQEAATRSDLLARVAVKFRNEREEPAAT